MSDLPWLDSYSGATTDELLSLEGRYTTDSLVLVFEQALNEKAAREGPESKPFLFAIINTLPGPTTSRAICFPRHRLPAWPRRDSGANWIAGQLAEQSACMAASAIL
jgi:hypothetical protein